MIESNEEGEGSEGISRVTAKYRMNGVLKLQKAYLCWGWGK